MVHFHDFLIRLARTGSHESEKDMKRPYSLQAKDVTLNFVKDKYGPNERQDLGKLLSHDDVQISEFLFRKFLFRFGG